MKTIRNDINWLRDPDPYARIYILAGGVSDRRLRLAGVATCRRAEAVMEDERCRHALDVAERYADGRADKQEMAGAHQVCLQARVDLGERVETAIVSPTRPDGMGDGLVTAMEAIRRLEGATTRPNGTLPASQLHRELLNDIFGSLYRPVAFQSAWRTPTVMRLAQTIYDERSFGELPVLADALEDAGCDWTEILDHLRGGGNHVRGCWALDQCLGIDELTEEEWLEGNDSWPMYLYVHPLLSKRKLHLLGCAFCRRIWDLADDFFQNLLVAVERHVEGQPPAEDEFVYLNNSRIFGGDGPVVFAFGNLSMVERPVVHTTGSILHDTAAARGEEAFLTVMDEVGDPGPATDRACKEAEQVEKSAQAELLRCIVGNPFCPVAIARKWKTREVKALAQSMYDRHDFGEMPLLADLLARAGSTEPAILDHCKGPGPHARGCWVIDQLLGRK